MTLEWAWQTFFGVLVGVANFFLGKLFIQAVTVGATALGGLWALEWA